jgi:hypothetical protein
MVPPMMERKIPALLEVLDADIRHLESALSGLDTLRTLLIKREDAALEQLLAGIVQQAEAYRANEQRRQQLRRELASDLGWAEGDLTLSRLQSVLSGGVAPDAQPGRPAPKGRCAPGALRAGAVPRPPAIREQPRSEGPLRVRLDARVALAERQARLRSLTAQLKREHALTVLLLRDCARLNRSLLKAFLGSGGRGGALYNPTGTEKRPAGAALISMKL